MRKLIKILTNRIVLFVFITTAVLVAIALLGLFLNNLTKYFCFVLFFLSAVCSAEIFCRNTCVEYKIAWLLVLTCLPFVGALFYALLGRKTVSKKIQERQSKTKKKLALKLQKNFCPPPTFCTDNTFQKCATFVQKATGLSACKTENLRYFSTGESFFFALKEALLSAKKFVFLEYFIIDNGKMWGEILNILKEKVKSGVDVRIVYDDFGSLLTLPRTYPKNLKKFGIAAMRFNPIVPLLDARLNTRNHKKLAIVDGKIAFTGGINIADEYINEKERFGHWRDCGVCFTGAAVNNFTISFLETWSIKHKTEDISKFLCNPDGCSQQNSYILPFVDSPKSKERIFENLLLKLIYSAKKRIFVSSPYVILNSELKTAIMSAALSGVDVAILIPGKPDKKAAYQMTKAFCTELLSSGVSIFKYQNGFNHGKTFVIDDKYSIVGSSNLDLRSFYSNYECGIFANDINFAKKINKDFLQATKLSKKMKKPEKYGPLKKAFHFVLRILAPIM